MFATARLGTKGTRLGVRSFSSATQKGPSRIQNSLKFSHRHLLPRNGLVLGSARSNFAPSMIRGAMQTRGIVTETVTTAVVIHGKAVGAGAACLGLAGI
jgi:F-type H+-transporting ATPase subunit c